jgi:hypothetical protein
LALLTQLAHLMQLGLALLTQWLALLTQVAHLTQVGLAHLTQKGAQFTPVAHLTQEDHSSSQGKIIRLARLHKAQTPLRRH